MRALTAAKAMAKAIKRTYLSCVLIMCWFHLKYNLRKHKSLLPNKAYLIVCKQINKLHECTCAGTYALLLRKTLKSWDQYPRFKNYFTKQWINSSFNNWQVCIYLKKTQKNKGDFFVSCTLFRNVRFPEMILYR